MANANEAVTIDFAGKLLLNSVRIEDGPLDGVELQFVLNEEGDLCVADTDQPSIRSFTGMISIQPEVGLRFSRAVKSGVVCKAGMTM